MKFTTAILSTALLIPGVNAQVAKFAAGWRDSDKGISLAFGDKADNKVGTKSTMFKEKLATIKSAQNKEMLIGLSGMINLITFTEAKGKNKEGEVTSVAEANVKAKVVLVPTGSGIAAPCSSGDAIIAAPGEITMSARKQTLTVDVALEADAKDLEITINGYVEVGLELDTTAAHSFQFVAYDLRSDTYDVYACWRQAVRGSLDGADPLFTPEGGWAAAAAITKRMLTVQQVRGVKTDDSGIDVGSGNIRLLRN